MTSARTRAIALAAAAEAFSEGTGLVLVRELRAFLESDSAAVASEPRAADADGELAALRAEVDRLRQELARANDAARKRAKRAAMNHAPSAPVDARQVDLFAKRPADVRTSDRTFSPRDPDPGSISNSGRKDPPTSATSVRHDAEHPPRWVFDDGASARPDLGEYTLREMWRRFVRRRAWHKSDADARRHFGLWLSKQEDRPSKRFAAAPEPPPDADEPSEAFDPPELFEAPRDPDDVCLIPLDLRREIALAGLRDLMAATEEAIAEPPGCDAAAE